MFLQETYEILDTKMYADATTVNTWTTSPATNAVDYNSSYIMSDGETAFFKLNSLPTMYVIGFVQGNNYCQLQKDGNTIKIYVNGQSVDTISGTLTIDSVIKFEKVSDTSQKIYLDDALIKTVTNHSMTAPNLVVRKYNSYPYNMGYVYVL